MAEKSSGRNRCDFMSQEQKTKMGKLPRTHENCLKETGVARPGKTAKDKAIGAWMDKANRRQRAIDVMMAVQKQTLKQLGA